MRNFSPCVAVAVPVVVISLFAVARAEASPFTFQFNLPAWDDVSSTSAFGTSGVLDVTVDNGTASDLSTTYPLADVVSASFTAVGGSFSDSWTTAQILFIENGGTEFLVTDGAGTPTLDLLSRTPEAQIHFFNSGGSLQIGIVPPGGGLYPIFLETAAGTADVVGPDTCDFLCGFEVQGSPLTTSAVPEPTSMMLLSTGIALLASRRRSHRPLI